MVPLPDSSQEIPRLKALHNAAGLVFCLHQVHPLFHNDEASLHNLCNCLLSLLQDRSAVILSLKNGVKYDTTIRLFAGVVSGMIRDDNERKGLTSAFQPHSQTLINLSLFYIHLCHDLQMNMQI